MRNLRDLTQKVSELIDTPPPSVGIDYDGCIDECPLFFQVLTSAWPGYVYIITCRTSHDDVANDLDRLQISYNRIFVTKSFEEKAEIIKQMGILTYFDDQPEILKFVPASVNVMLVRNEGNYDYEDNKWTLSKETGKLLDA